MKTVCIGFVSELLTPLGALSDDETASLMKVNPNNEKAVRQVIKILIKPYFCRFSEESRAIAKDSLRFFLNDHASVTLKSLIDVFYVRLPPFELPDDPKLFYIWLWNELFDDEDYQLSDSSQYEVKNDAATLAKFQIAPGIEPTWFPTQSE